MNSRNTRQSSIFLLTPLREGRHRGHDQNFGRIRFLLTPLREGRRDSEFLLAVAGKISTHAPAGGATAPPSTPKPAHTPFLLTPLREGRPSSNNSTAERSVFLLTPLREGRPRGTRAMAQPSINFYSRPCGRGDGLNGCHKSVRVISTHAPAGGATLSHRTRATGRIDFYSRPCGRGDGCGSWRRRALPPYFYSRPCGRGDRQGSRR